MTRLIDADALIDKVDKYIYRITRASKLKVGESAIIADIKAHIELSPTIEAEPVRHGKWIWVSSTYDRTPMEREYECSECHHKTILHGDGLPWEKYCSNCGARMDKE